MSDIQQPVVGILAASDTVRREVVVVDPDIGRVLKLYQILLAWGVVQVQVPENHIVRPLDPDTSIGQAYEGSISMMTLNKKMDNNSSEYH